MSMESLGLDQHWPHRQNWMLNLTCSQNLDFGTINIQTGSI
jgi:hypothetical protein